MRVRGSARAMRVSGCARAMLMGVRLWRPCSWWQRTRARAEDVLDLGQRVAVDTSGLEWRAEEVRTDGRLFKLRRLVEQLRAQRVEERGGIARREWQARVL